MITNRISTVAILVGALLAPAAWAGAPSSKYRLSNIVPAEAWLYAHGVKNPEREFLEKHWSHVFEAVCTSGIDQDIKALIEQDMQSPEDKAEFNLRWEKITGLIKEVQWGSLVHHEAVYFQQGLMDYALVMRPDAKTMDENVQGLVALLTELGSLVGEAQVAKSQRSDAQVWTLPVADLFSATVFQRQDVVGVVLGARGAGEIIDRLAGSHPTEALVQTAKYRSAVGQLPPPEDAVVFMDMSKLWGVVKQAVGSHDHHQPGDPAAPKRGVILKIMDQFDFIDYIAVTEQTDGLQTREHSVTKLSNGARSKRLCRVLVDQKPISSVLKHVPRDATGYWAWSGADLGSLYSFAKEFVEANFEEGPGWTARWSEWQQQNGFNLQEDILSWIDGQTVSVSFPSAMPMGMGMGGGDFVMMVKTRDGQKALAALNKQIDRFSESLMISPAAGVEAPGFRSVTHPMFAMMGQLTYGVAGDWLYFGTTPTAVNQCLAVASGSAPTFESNPRFMKEGVPPKGPVVWAAFADTTNSGPETAMAIGMGMPMAAAMIPPTPETEVMRRMFTMIGKLAPAIAKMDFELSNSSTSTFRNDRWVSEVVHTYKDYTPPPPPPTPGTKSGSVDGL